MVNCAVWAACVKRNIYIFNIFFKTNEQHISQAFWEQQGQIPTP
jgi:hypothetical protein